MSGMEQKRVGIEEVDPEAMMFDGLIERNGT